MSDLLSAARANLLLAPTGFALAILSSTLVARCLGPEIYADYATVTSLLSWLLLLGDMGGNMGIGRYMNEADKTQAQAGLYLTLQRRRWAGALILTSILIFLGPLWAAKTGLNPHLWGNVLFGLIGLLAAITLHGQLANNTLLSGFLHKRMLLVSQSMTIVRSLALTGVAGLTRNPLYLVLTLVTTATIESTLMHRSVMASLPQPAAPLPGGMAWKTQVHGMVSQFDKITSNLNSGSFLVLFLAGSQNRTDLAMLAIATDFLQKTLGVISLPYNNMVIPIFNNCRNDPVRMKRHISLLGSLTAILFSASCGLGMALLPPGIPLLFGKNYAPAATLALIWIVPLFLESAGRAIWGMALLALDHRKWLMSYNTLFGGITLAGLFLFRLSSIETLLIVMGAIRVFMSALLLTKAARSGLLPPQTCPVGLIVAAFGSGALGYVLQNCVPKEHDLPRLAVGLAGFALPYFLSLRYLNLFPATAHQALLRISGKFAPLLSIVIPSQRNPY